MNSLTEGCPHTQTSVQPPTSSHLALCSLLNPRSEFPKGYDQQSPMCHQKISEAVKGTKPPTWWFSLQFLIISVFAPFPAFFFHLSSYRTALTPWAAVSIYRARNLGHCALFRVRYFAITLTQDKYQHLPLLFLPSKCWPHSIWLWNWANWFHHSFSAI